MLKEARMNRQPTRWFTHYLSDILFVIGIVFLLGGTIVALVASRAALETQAIAAQSSPPTRSVTTTSGGTRAPTIGVMERQAQAHIFPFPSSNNGLMLPSVGAQGTIWVGEMYANNLARLNTRTGVVTTWKQPHAESGIMTTVVDAHGTIWFVEQNADYIGRFDPAQQTFQIFPLGTINGHSMGPQALQFDAAGKLWFTALAGGRIGRLDPTTGAIQSWAVPSPAVGVRPYPFSLTVTTRGQVWFSYLTGGAVGELNPATGHVTLYHLASIQAEVFSLASDARGRIWFTEIVPGILGMIDPTTNNVTEIPVPSVQGRPAALYSIVITRTNDVWFVNNGGGALVRYVPGSTRMTFFQLAGTNTGPYGLTLASNGTLWFTLSGTATNAVGEMAS